VALSSFIPNRTSHALGKVIDFAELYKLAPKIGNASIGSPCDAYFAKAAYVPSLVPNPDEELGRKKK